MHKLWSLKQNRYINISSPTWYCPLNLQVFVLDLISIKTLLHFDKPKKKKKTIVTYYKIWGFCCTVDAHIIRKIKVIMLSIMSITILLNPKKTNWITRWTENWKLLYWTILWPHIEHFKNSMATRTGNLISKRNSRLK